jgi:hypothetical protein
VVEGDQTTLQCQGRTGVVAGAPALAIPAAVPVGLVVGQEAAAHRGRGREQVGDAAAQTVAPATALGLIVAQQAVANGNDASVKLAEYGGVVVAQPIEDAGTRAETGDDVPAAVGRVVAAAAGLVVVQVAVFYVGRASKVVRNARADAGPDQTCHCRSAVVVVAAGATVLGENATANGESVWPPRRGAAEGGRNRAPPGLRPPVSLGCLRYCRCRRWPDCGRGCCTKQSCRPTRIEKSASLSASGGDKVGPGSSRVIAADGLVVAESAGGNVDHARFKGAYVKNGPAVGIIHDEKRVAQTAIAAASTEGLVVVEPAPRD